MKILHVNFSDNLGGASISVLRLHKFLLNKGVDSHLLVSEKELNEKNVVGISKTSEKIKNIIKSTVSRNLKIIFKTSNKNTHSLNLIPSKLLKIINDFNADIVNLHWLGNETLSIKQIGKIKSEVVWTLHDMWPFCGAEHYTLDRRYEEGYRKSNKPNYETGFDLNKYIWKKKISSFKKVNKIIATSTWMKNCVKKSYLFKNKNIEEIPLILDQKIWCPIHEKDAARKILGLSLDKKIITFGSDNYLNNNRKGFNHFLDLTKNYIDNENIEFVIFGENNFNKLNTYLNKLSLRMNLKNLGKINDETTMKLLYTATDVIVSPSIIEAFGLIVFEALNMGTPCVIFENTGSESMVDHKQNGYIAKFKSSQDLSNGVSWCLDNLTDKKIVHEYSLKKINSDESMVKYINFLKSK